MCSPQYMDIHFLPSRVSHYGRCLSVCSMYSSEDSVGSWNNQMSYPAKSQSQAGSDWLMAPLAMPDADGMMIPGPREAPNLYNPPMPMSTTPPGPPMLDSNGMSFYNPPMPMHVAPGPPPLDGDGMNFSSTPMPMHATTTAGPPGLDGNGMVMPAPAHGLPAFYPPSLAPRDERNLQLSSEMCSQSGFWPEAQFDHPIFPESTGCQPADTMVPVNDRLCDMSSDGQNGSFTSYDGSYSTSTSPFSPPYAHDDASIKHESGPCSLRRDSKHDIRSFSTPTRRSDRRDSRRSSAISKRKTRMASLMESFDTHHNGCQVQVKYPADLQLDMHSGRLCSAAGETKKQRCRYPDCTKTFARPEHLKRHESTHSKERPYPCVVPHCGRRFSRNDNRKAHYETHLKESMLGKKARNSPVTFEQLRLYLSQYETKEDAQKMIEKLENPKSKSKSKE